ncbi:MAG TPA: hypothetical protein VLL75_04400 [Vicinamibacteria bacterium]|nr:hypothetical protein [Vicinamibacteria bacterium]
MPSLRAETSDAALFLTLERPSRNVLDPATTREMHARWSRS